MDEINTLKKINSTLKLKSILNFFIENSLFIFKSSIQMFY